MQRVKGWYHQAYLLYFEDSVVRQHLVIGICIWAASTFAGGYENCGATLSYLQHVPDEDRQIVVVGMGAVTPLGNSVESTWDAVVQGKSGVSTLSGLSEAETKYLPVRIAGQVKDFELDPKKTGFLNRTAAMSRSHQFALAASIEAAMQSGILQRDADGNWKISHDPDDLGIFIGSTQGDVAGIEDAALELDRILREDPSKIAEAISDPQLALKSIPSLGAAHVSIALQGRGPILCPSSACASGAQSIALAASLIPHTAEEFVAGASDSQTSKLGLVIRANLKVLSLRNEDPEGASRTFDIGRDGFVMGEGAGVLRLTSMRKAKEMGYPILAYLAGWGMTADANKVTDPTPAGQVKAMSRALKQAGLEPSQIGYLHAHGTSTKKGDIAELEGIKTVFGDHAFTLPISSTKSHMGHLLGASGSVGAILAIQAMNRGLLPATRNLQQPSLSKVKGYNVTEEDMGRFHLIRGEAEPANIEAVAVNSFGLGGQNVVLIFVKPPRKD